MNASPASTSTYVNTPTDEALAALCFAVIVFTWPLTGAWKASTNHADVWDIRRNVAVTSIAGLIIYAASAALVYLGLSWWWLVLSGILYLIASFLRFLAQISHDD